MFASPRVIEVSVLVIDGDGWLCVAARKTVIFKSTFIGLKTHLIIVWMWDKGLHQIRCLLFVTFTTDAVYK